LAYWRAASLALGQSRALAFGAAQPLVKQSTRDRGRAAILVARNPAQTICRV
jgi:hypothetical protein